jgi:hypothetical protein
MRPAMVFAFSVCLVLLSPRHTLAQSSPNPGPRMFSPSSDRQSPAGSRLTRFGVEPDGEKTLEFEGRRGPGNPFQELPPNPTSSVDLPSSPRAHECADILIYQAREVDPKMIIKTPEAAIQTMPEAHGLPACRAEIFTVGARPATVPGESGRR